MATQSCVLAWRIPWTEEGYSPWGHKESDTTEVIQHFTGRTDVEAEAPVLWPSDAKS